MDQVIRDRDILVESGLASGGRMFVRVRHQPTNTRRKLVGLGGRSYRQVVDELRTAVEADLVNRGWVRSVERGRA